MRLAAATPIRAAINARERDTPSRPGWRSTLAATQGDMPQPRPTEVHTHAQRTIGSCICSPR